MATVYISSSGSDAYTYAQAQSSATPWLTIGKANTSATTGDTIIILNSITWAGVTFTKSFTIQGNTTNPASIVLNAGGGVSVWTPVVSGYLTISNLRFTNWAGTSSNGCFSQSVNGTTITMTNCVIDTIAGGATDPSHVGSVFGMGNSVSNSTLYLTNVTVYGISRNSVSHSIRVIAGRITTNARIFLTNTTFHNSLASSLRMNDFVANISGGITLTYKNCIFSDESNAPLSVSSGCTVTSITYCDFYQTNVPTSTFSIASNPLFVDTANGNFNLRPTSPCIDTGTLV